MSDIRILAQFNFENAYKEYTEASNQISIAFTEQEKEKAQERFKKASDRFNLAYKNLKDVENEA